MSAQDRAFHNSGMQPIFWEQCTGDCFNNESSYYFSQLLMPVSNSAACFCSLSCGCYPESNGLSRPPLVDLWRDSSGFDSPYLNLSWRPSSRDTFSLSMIFLVFPNSWYLTPVTRKLPNPKSGLAGLIHQCITATPLLMLQAHSNICIFYPSKRSGKMAERLRRVTQA